MEFAGKYMMESDSPHAIFHQFDPKLTINLTKAAVPTRWQTPEVEALKAMPSIAFGAQGLGFNPY